MSLPLGVTAHAAPAQHTEATVRVVPAGDGPGEPIHHHHYHGGLGLILGLGVIL
ncbi:hypothetical protein [Streptomyces aquilus]|uniref:hypothetical protein n=1 Tax=Streptomyces aquilus TaxID=2548456 RepID=UPI003676794C